jgi:iron complex outermembrane receptor protein
LTVDFYLIEVDDRIYKTGNIPDPATGGSIAFYTNALDVEHTGIDVVLTTGFGNTDVTFAYSYTEAEVTGQTPVLSPTGPILPVSADNIEDIENNFPNSRFVLSTNSAFGDNLNLMLRLNYYGEHFDERGTIGGAPGDRSWEVGSTIYLDLDLAYQLNDNWRINVGAVNILDEFVDIIPDDGVHANRISVGLPYPRRSAANYEGGQWYLRGTYSFQ